MQLALQVFSVRDRLAHGKPERVPGPLCDTYMDAKSIIMVQLLRPDWFKAVDREWVLATEERVDNLLRYIGALYHLPPDDFMNHSQGEITEHP